MSSFNQFAVGESRHAGSHFQSHASPGFEVENLNLGWSRGFAWAASCSNHYNGEVSIDVSKGLSETSEDCPGTRTFANFLRQSVSWLNPEDTGKKRKEKRNYEVARKWEKSDSITSQLIWSYGIPAAQFPLSLQEVSLGHGRLFFNDLWEWNVPIHFYIANEMAIFFLQSKKNYDILYTQI